MFTMRVEGLQGLAEALNGLSARVRRSVLLEVLTDAAQPMRRRMGQFAPYEPGPPVPDLRDAMVISPSRKTIGGDGLSVRNDEFQATVAVGPSQEAPHGILQEYGTVNHGANPHVRPAFDSEAPKAIPVIGEALWRELAGRGINRPTIESPSVPIGTGRLT